MEQVKVDLDNRSYLIEIGSDLLSRRWVYPACEEKRKLLLISDENVYPLYGEKVEDGFRDAGWEVLSRVIAPGEESKKLSKAEELYQLLIDKGFDRSSSIAALGGGVVGDLAGFVASTYLRGISYYQLPTSLLAQVDSSVGGKVAVNHPRGKNLIGSFYQPRGVFIDVSTLRTLSQKQVSSGLAEVIKYGMIWDHGFFLFCEEKMDRLMELESVTMALAVKRCCQIKAEIVSHDEEDRGLRTILNYGHTLGHALEAAYGYGRLSHGEAVSIGISFAAGLACRMNLLDEELVDNKRALLRRAGLPVSFNDASVEKVMGYLQQDKKRQGQDIPFVLPVGKGKVRLFKDIETDFLEDSLQRFFSGGEEQ